MHGNLRLYVGMYVGAVPAKFLIVTQAPGYLDNCKLCAACSIIQ